MLTIMNLLLIRRTDIYQSVHCGFRLTWVQFGSQSFYRNGIQCAGGMYTNEYTYINLT